MGNAIRMIHDSIPIQSLVLDMDPRMWVEPMEELQLEHPPEPDATQAYKTIFDAMKANGSMQPGEQVRLEITDEQAVQIAQQALMNNRKQGE